MTGHSSTARPSYDSSAKTAATSRSHRSEASANAPTSARPPPAYDSDGDESDESDDSVVPLSPPPPPPPPQVYELTDSDSDSEEIREIRPKRKLLVGEAAMLKLGKQASKKLTREFMQQCALILLDAPHVTAVRLAARNSNREHPHSS